MDPITDRTAPARPVYEYDLPAEVQAIGDPLVKRSVGLSKLDMQTELSCIDRAGRSAGKLGYYLATAALVEVDGRRLNKGDAEDELVMNQTDAAIRALVLDAYVDMAGVSKEASEAFIKSRRVKVG